MSGFLRGYGGGCWESVLLGYVNRAIFKQK